MKLYEDEILRSKNKLVNDGISDPTSDQVAMQFVRDYRTSLLSNCDWMSGSDVNMSEEWKTYRQALRDLPSSSTPKLDKDNNLTGVEWPTKPE